MTEQEQITLLITGATGNIGSGVIRILSGNPVKAVAAVTSPEKASLLPAGIDHHVYQLDDIESVLKACENTDHLFMVVPFHPDMVERGLGLVCAAQEAGVKHIVKISGWHSAPDSISEMAALHGIIDDAIMQSGMTYTILRCNSFMENYTKLYGPMIRKRKALHLPEGEATFAFISTEDIAAVAAEALLNPHEHKYKTYDLTGHQSLSHADAMEILSRYVPEQVSYSAIPVETASETYRKMGASEWEVEVLESLSNYLAEGNASEPTAIVESILGRKPVSLEEFFRKTSGEFTD